MYTMTIFALSLLIFTAGYLLNVFYITVLYHRGLTHSALKLSPLALWMLEHTGIWVTGIDPKSWACMHRLHHLHSDTDLDPHSPVKYGVLGVAMAQLKSYEKILRSLIKRDPKITKVVSDIAFDVNTLNRRKIWYVPYLLHLSLAIAVGIIFGHWILAIAYFAGIMSHPVQGWMVNSLAHRFGYQNFDNHDQSKNNYVVALLVFGEGYQNNHHSFPQSANFARRWFEVDLGYFLCLGADLVGLVEITKPQPQAV